MATTRAAAASSGEGSKGWEREATRMLPPCAESDNALPIESGGCAERTSVMLSDEEREMGFGSDSMLLQLPLCDISGGNMVISKRRRRN